MKIHGKVVQKCVILTVLPRESEDLVFKARALFRDDYVEFDKICPEPIPPLKTEPGKNPYNDFNDKDFVKSAREYSNNKYNFMILKSLSETPGLEWEKVKPDDPKTWIEYEEELLKVLTPVEKRRLIDSVYTANGLDDKKIEEAKERFINRELQKQETGHSRTEEPVNTARGEPVKD